MNDPTGGLLGISLSVAVPLWIDQIRKRGGPNDSDYARARECSQLLAEKGDVLQFRSPKPGETAAVFNRLAEAMAVLAFCPGGVKFDGMRFEANPQPESESDMKKTTQPAEDHPLRHNRTTAKPRKSAVPFTVPAGEDWLRLVHMARAEHPGMLIAVRVRNAYTFYGPDVEPAAKLCNLTPFKSNGPGVESASVQACEFPAVDLERVLRTLLTAGHRVAVIETDSDTAVPVAPPPSPEEQAAFRAPYNAIQLRHVRGECWAYWTMKDGKYSAHKGRKVSGFQVGPFIVHTEPTANYAVTHEATGLRVGALNFADMAEAKLFALLAGWNHSWDFAGKAFPDAETEFATALIKAWRDGRWDTITKLCTLEKAEIANPEPGTGQTFTEAFDAAVGLAAKAQAAGFVPVHVDKPTQPTITADAVKVHEHLRCGKCDFKTLSALLDFDQKRTVAALLELRNVSYVRHVEQSAKGPLAQNFGPGDSFELLTESA